MSYVCNHCGVEFDEPYVIRRRENLDNEHGWMTWQIPVCPCCKSENIEEGKDSSAEM